MATKREMVEAAGLVVACRRGDAEAWDELLDRFERLVFAVALREGLSIEDAADVTQTTFEALLAQLDRIRDDTQVASWLMTVARRQAWRVRKDRDRLRPDEQTTLDGTEDMIDPTDDTADVLWVYQGMSELGSPCRDLITALYFDPGTPSYAEVATRLGRPVGSIGPTRARCLQRLRHILGEANRV
ncbi:MAG: sigma-70 family RNA polymerase sigma factor [Actinomycetota bacterium]